MCAVVVVVVGGDGSVLRFCVCLLVCVCACAWCCVGEEEWRLLTWYLFYATIASDQCATQCSFIKITSTVGIYYHTIIGQGKKKKTFPFIKLKHKAGFHSALMASPDTITLFDIQISYFYRISDSFFPFFR